MEAIILAGGFGTRLRQVVSDVPKPMAPINDNPFLVYILDYLSEYNFEKVILAVGHKSKYIKDYFKDSYKGMQIIYSEEDSPLGTGGAIKKAILECKTDDVFILNGDTYFDVDLLKMKNFHQQSKAEITIAVKKMFNYDRYGSVIINDNKVINFIEKKSTKEGIINGGIYLFNKKLMCEVTDEIFSFEKVILESLKYNIYAFESNGYFIDIGIPDDYRKAQGDFINER